MTGGFRVGKIFGITVRVDWSWLLIFSLVIWNLAFSFASLHPTWSSLTRWTVAVVAALLFFLSVLAHELAHSLVARAGGLPVRNITLFMFGGVSNIEKEPKSPGSEFVMAIVGPLTSLVLGALFLVLANTTIDQGIASLRNPMGALRGMDPATTLFLWLGSVNILVGLFNLIPGFPLDGGRVLRSILWQIMGSLQKATRVATIVGQAIAWMFIFAGVAMAFGFEIPILGTGLGSGIWIAFIGWFLYQASTQSYRQVVLQDLLDGVRVSQLMRADPPAVSENTSVQELVEDYLLGKDDHAFPVMSDGQLRGLVTLNDVPKIPKDRWSATPIQEIMTPMDQLVATSPDEEASAAMEKMARRNLRQLPVMRGQQLVGLLREKDILLWLQLVGTNRR